MPIYEFECSHCGLVVERAMKMEDSDILYIEHCSGAMAKKIPSRLQAVKPDWDEYWDDNLESEPGKASLVTGRKVRRELMKKQGLEEKTIDASKLRIRKQEFAERRIERLKERGEFNG